ncbi:Bifunctional ligase/repressor BirA [Candidatus Ecksteinia adelgidicola]|nr:Bifunctional ligase/repressor BirA [Candidatus Ecksteinia adelgidicola]
MKNIKIKMKLITLLSNGDFHFSKTLIKMLNIDQKTLDQYIQSILTWGVNVLIIPNKGYILLNSIQCLKINHILNFLEDKRIIVIPIVNSTNQYLLDHICSLKSGDVCISEYQKHGRGRYGRKWISPFGMNICLSIFWCFKKELITVIGLSLIIGIIVAEVLQGFGATDVRVKWPNDIYLNNRKLAGILIECVKKNNFNYLVIGIGINIAMQDTFKNIINKKWINLQEAGIYIDRNKLTAILINEIRYSLKKFECSGMIPFLDRWRRLDNFINQSVKLLINKHYIFGICRGIDQHGALLLDQEGIVKSFFNGEISLRTIE